MANHPSSLPTAIAEEKINYFRGSQIFLEHLSFVMRDIFVTQIKQKKKYEWKNSPSNGALFMHYEKWTEKLSKTMQDLLRKGDCNRWDPTLLFHVLLFSSNCLLLETVGVCVKANPVSKVVKISGNAERVQCGSVLIFDLGQTFFRSSVTNVVGRSEFQLKKIFPQNIASISVYICTPKWRVLDKLSWSRNEYFAHRHSCSMSSRELDEVVKEVTEAYTTLQVPQRIIDEMRAIRNKTIGDKQLVDEIKKYRELWLVELSNIKKVEQDVADIETDVQQLKHTVTDVKEDFTDHQHKCDERFSSLETHLQQTDDSLSETAANVSHNASAIQELEERQSHLERTLQYDDTNTNAVSDLVNYNIHKRIFQNSSPALRDYLNVETISPHLYKNDLLTEEQFDWLTDTPIRRKKIELLEQWIPNSSENFLEKFLKCLQEEEEHLGHSELLRQLQEEIDRGLHEL